MLIINQNVQLTGAFKKLLLSQFKIDIIHFSLVYACSLNSPCLQIVLHASSSVNPFLFSSLPKKLSFGTVLDFFPLHQSPYQSCLFHVSHLLSSPRIRVNTLTMKMYNKNQYYYIINILIE